MSVGLFIDHARGRRPHLEWKVRLFAVGAVLGVAGMGLEEPWLTGAGIVVLLAGVLVRFVPGGGDGAGQAGEDEEGERP